MKKTRYTVLKTALVIFLFIILRDGLHAQPYNHSVGIRAGFSSGISYKGFRLHRMSAFELDFLYNSHGFNLGGLYEYHLEPFKKNSRTFIYLGGGAFGGDWDDEFSLGVAAVGGIEYTLRDLPLNFSFDWKPMLNIYADFEPEFLDFGLSIRYRFRN